MHSVERSEYSLVQKLRRVKRFLSLEEFFHPVSHAIAGEFFNELDADAGNKEYM
ncbi:hypothetical protein PIB30_115748, partial [Stylosanthes scabra]|nr:hypothetical protein [Stylosanthes scabra]